MGKTKGVYKLLVSIQTGSWRSCRPLVFNESTKVPGVSSQQSTHNCNKLSPTTASPLLNLHVCVSSNCALVCVCVLRMCVYVQICMQSCVKFACWVHLYVSVCVCVSHDSRLIKLLHSNELWLSVWQLLWQPLFTTSPPTHIHTSAHTHKHKHTCIQVHAPTWGIPQLWKGFDAHNCTDALLFLLL